jgi:hypothetical protein
MFANTMCAHNVGLMSDGPRRTHASTRLLQCDEADLRPTIDGLVHQRASKASALCVQGIFMLASSCRPNVQVHPIKVTYAYARRVRCCHAHNTLASRPMSFRFGSCASNRSRKVSAAARPSTADGVWENQRFYYAFGWCESFRLLRCFACFELPLSHGLVSKPVTWPARERSLGLQACPVPVA